MKKQVYKLFSRKALLAVALFICFSPHLLSQENTDMDIYDLDLEALMNIEIVSASKQSETIFDAPLGASVITGDDIINSGATNIMEALRLLPGVIVRETTPGNFDIHVRGFDAVDPNALITLSTNTITLIMVNNRPVYNEFQGQTFWESVYVGIEDIERIELVRGPVSAMYGPNGVAGVINIITKDPNQKEGFYFNTYSQGGVSSVSKFDNAGINTLNGNFIVGYGMKNGLSFKFGGSYDKRDRHDNLYYMSFYKDFLELSDTLKSASGRPITNPDIPSTAINIKDRYPHPELSTDRYTANFHINYTKDKIKSNLMLGLTDADVQRIWANNNISSISNDESLNKMIHFWSDIYNLNISADFQDGDFRVLGSGKTLEIDNYQILNGNIEYNVKLFNEMLSVKPGFAYRLSKFDGMVVGSSMINRDNPTNWSYQEDEGYKENSSMGGHLRADFRYNKLRLIGALRGDKFQYPDKLAFSYLGTATYKVSDDFLIRANYGRAFRTPFMMDLFFKVDLKYPTDFIPNVTEWYTLHYRGTERAADVPDFNIDYEFTTVDEAEIGFRHQVTKTFLLDFDVFWSRMRNLLTLATIGSMEVDPLTTPGEVYYRNYISFTNLDMEPEQTGATMSMTSMPFPKSVFRIFVTVQSTKIHKYYEALDTLGNAVDLDGDGEPYVDFYHKATPSFYGGVNFDNQLFKRLHLNINSYFYPEQTMSIGDGIGGSMTAEVPAAIIVNSNISYEITKGINVFANGRNLSASAKRQHAFADRIYSTFLMGVRISL